MYLRTSDLNEDCLLRQVFEGNFEVFNSRFTLFWPYSPNLIVNLEEMGQEYGTNDLQIFSP